MINNDRIVPVTVTDLITLYGTIFKIANKSVTAIDAISTDGRFEVKTAQKSYICTEPVKSIDFTGEAAEDLVYFVPSYDFEGFLQNGEMTSNVTGEIVPDGKTLYLANGGASDNITISKFGM